MLFLQVQSMSNKFLGGQKSRIAPLYQLSLKPSLSSFDSNHAMENLENSYEVVFT